jgi:C-terminal processing protease CtpA/Prc
MTRRPLVALILILASTDAGRGQDTASLARQLTFETEHAGGTPAGWGVSPAGAAVADGKIVRTGRWSARLDRSAETAGAFSTLTMALPLEIAGKAIVLRGFLRSEGVTGSIALWMRVDGETPNLAFDTTQRRQVKGTNDWQEHVVTVPVNPRGRRLIFGALLAGAGTLWVDDLELLVDGVPFASAPRIERPLTVLESDREFDAGSRVEIGTLSAVQLDNLVALGKVWGFLKYHHPAVTSGARQWDYDLFRVLPSVMASASRDAGNTALVQWIDGLGPLSACTPCAALRPETVHLSPDLVWIEDTSRLGADLSRRLRSIHASRPADGSQFYVSLTPGVGNPSFGRELPYASFQLPDAGYRLLALYRFWNIVEYWFPYRDVIGEDWDAVLREFIPRVTAVASPPEYQRALIALIARVHDTHANLWSSLAVRPPVGTCQVPAVLRFIEGQAVVTLAGGGLERGDVVTALDGTGVSTLIAEWSPYYAASNTPTRLRDIARSMTRGACGPVTMTVTRPSGTTTISTTRVASPPPSGAPTQDLPGDTFRRFSTDVAYLKLSTIKAADVPGYIKAAESTKGLVVDIRNYPSEFVVFALGQLLVREQTPFARFTIGDLANPGAFHWGAQVSLKPATPSYTGRVVILIDEISQSQAEYTAMALRVAPDALVVGSTTAGADGNVSPIPLPGGLRSMISGIGVFYPDKRPTQRLGIVPDVVASPTIAGIRAGRDEVLEAGIRQIVGPAMPAAAIQQMIAGR